MEKKRNKKFEPLKGKYEECEKGKWCEIIKGGHIICGVGQDRVLNDVKSAVHGLLKEIEENLEKSKMGYYPEVIIEVANDIVKFKTRREIVEGTLEWCIRKIKKWFADVIENER